MTNLLHRLNQREIPICLFFNKINQKKFTSLFFSMISRLGDGVFWYTIMLSLPFIYGKDGIYSALHMSIVGLVALLIYKWMKTSTQRVRPYHFNKNIFQNVAALDQFSFPSGHTMHAVSFSIILLSYYPEWVLLVLPFTLLVALSRLVLGLHYPSDVLIGIAIGASLSISSFFIMTLNF
ncbi:MAG: phosphatase PAP2 family protein [bacterium]